MLHTRHAIPLVLLSLGANCQDNSLQIPPDWRILSFTSNQTQATVGDDMLLTWAYSTDEEVLSQRLCLKYLYYNAVGEECFDVDPAEREVDFPYVGAFTAHLVADSQYQHTEAALQVRDLKDAFMRARWQASDPFNPRLGLTSIEFSQFVALHDDDGDGKVDGLKDFFIGGHDHEFFRMRTVNPNGSSAGTYSHTQGASFGWAELPFPNPYNDIPDYANLLVLGGGIAIVGGETLGEFKTDEGRDGEFVVGEDLDFDPVFLQLSYLWGETAGIVTPTDIEVGNVAQGLVFGITSVWENLGSFGTPHTIWVDPTNPEDVRTTGSVKNASVTNFITPANGPTATRSVTLEDIAWEMPVFPDENLGPNSMFDFLLQENDDDDDEVTP